MKLDRSNSFWAKWWFNIKRFKLFFRSTIDEYCPPDQVDGIEKRVIELISDVYGDECIDVHFDYKDESRLLWKKRVIELLSDVYGDECLMRSW